MIIKHNNINLYNIFGDSPKIDISYHLSINLYDECLVFCHDFNHHTLILIIK